MLPLLTEIRACRVCEDLPLGPRPVFTADPSSKIVLIGQAPGTKVHASGIPWDDDSGTRLRSWLGVDEATFYGPAFAIVPMGFCYPGRKGGGDAPPRPECAPLWHERLLAEMPQLELILLIGMYAQKQYLGSRRKRTLTETVRAWPEYAPRLLPTPHPSWRVRMWMQKQPWFEAELLPELRARVAALV